MYHPSNPKSNRQSVAISEVLDYYQTIPSHHSSPERPPSRNRKQNPNSRPHLSSIRESPSLSINTSHPSMTASSAVVRGLSNRYTPQSRISHVPFSPYGQERPAQTLRPSSTASSIYSAYPKHHQSASTPWSNMFTTPQVLPTKTRADKRFEGHWLRQGTMRVDPKEMKKRAKEMERERLRVEKEMMKQRKRELKAMRRDSLED